MIEAFIIFGAISGAVYVLLALGFTLIYGVTDVVNLAHGALFMLGAYMFFAFLSLAQLERPLASIAAVIFTAIVASIIYRLTIHPVIDDEIAVLVVTVCVALILQQLILLRFGPTNVPIPSLLSGSVIIWGVTVLYSRLLASVLSLGLFVCLMTFIAKSKIGRAMRALAQDREAAMLMGINVERLYMLTMAISASLAAIASILISTSTTGVASPYMWLYPLVMSFSIVILGGLGSIKGTLIGAFIVGYAETAVIVFLPGGGLLRGVVPLAVMVLVLILRPKGIFGKRVELE